MRVISHLQGRLQLSSQSDIKTPWLSLGEYFFFTPANKGTNSAQYGVHHAYARAHLSALPIYVALALQTTGNESTGTLPTIKELSPM